ncbi:hypothetical protein CIL05_18355 [Virgibacillus profundi]|uniref:Uncharacterized protein n=1 Tax=Virgibacillus profundi TaxID=2024555 RepID=A0A2A2I7U5_9BACI|nr:UPF0158 family protein [Virgibacillus profundi]PAV28071.1 hypothetical protein CIL05_18355 [Virgibacillus profundi]PXY52375.1 hypothetical protein CIT14_17800 [Virgibacillus profundi]
MELMDELASAYLDNFDEMSYVLNKETGEVILDAPESLTGEPEVDWNDEEAESLLSIPQITSSEAYDVMLKFCDKQKPAITEKLARVLEGRKPFRNFKDKVIELGMEEQWYSFEQNEAKEVIMKWLSDHSLLYEMLNQKFRSDKK